MYSRPPVPGMLQPEQQNQWEFSSSDWLSCIQEQMQFQVQQTLPP